MEDETHLNNINEDLLKEELSTSTLEILKSFLSEKSSAGDGFEEDWSMSQFWYDEFTAKTLADEVFELTQNGVQKAACIACPSLFREIKKSYPMLPVQLLEYDKRFSNFGTEFTFYDYNDPVNISLELKNTFEVVIADPPYLSEECLLKTAETMNFLARNPLKSHYLLLTGAIQKDRALKFLNLKPCVFRPQHTKKLGNEFLLFANYSPTRIGGWEDEA